MALPGDPAALDAAARRINHHADDLRARAGRLAATADGVRWHSTAAGAFRRDVRWLASRPAPIAPLLDTLTFTAGKRNWGYQFRFGLIAISADDMTLIARAMKAKLPK
jgi:hypothetical protein